MWILFVCVFSCCLEHSLTFEVSAGRLADTGESLSGDTCCPESTLWTSKARQLGTADMAITGGNFGNSHKHTGQ